MRVVAKDLGEPLGCSDAARADQIAAQGKGETLLGLPVGELGQEKA